MKFHDPIVIKATEDYKIKRRQTLYGQNNQMGFFPIGRLNCWHGGVHLEGKHAICAIADGRVIAYRIPEDYIAEDDQDENVKYSNGFVLLLHDFKTPSGKKLTFYSLYHHLSPKSELDQSDKVPNFFAKTMATVKSDAKEEWIGLAARSADILDDKKGKKYYLIPLGHTFTLDPLNDSEVETTANSEQEASTSTPSSQHWSKQKGNERYQRIKFKSINGIDVSNVYTYINHPNYTKELGDGKYRVTLHTGNAVSKMSDVKVEEGKGAKGAHIFDKPNKKGEGKLLRIALPGEQFQVEKHNDEWFKLIELGDKEQYGKEQYVHKDFVDTKDSLDDTIELGSVVNVDIPIKAGEIIGFSGNYGIKNNDLYRAVHLEVFSEGKELDKFLGNTEDNDRNYYKTKAGSALFPHQPLRLIKGRIVRAFQRKDDFVQIGFEKLSSIVKWDLLHWKEEKNGVHQYEILEEDFEELNKAFDNGLEKSDILFLESRMEEVSPGEYKSITEEEEDNKDDTHVKYRKVSFVHPRSEEKFWVDKKYLTTMQDHNPFVFPNSLGTLGEVTQEVGPEEIYTKIPQRMLEPKEGYKPPFEELKNSMKIIRRLGSKTIKDKEWWKVKGNYEDPQGKTDIKTGWVKKEGLEEANPYDWYAHDWKIYEDAGDQFIYHFEEEDDASDFIKDIWAEVDLPDVVTQEDGTEKEYPSDKVLSRFELRIAMNQKRKVQKLSRMICKHPSEWDLKANNFPTLKKEIEALYQQGIEIEENSDRKKKMEEIRDKKLALTEEKVNNLCFWQDIQEGELPGQEEKGPDAPKRKFPTGNSTVYHFHPIAFVDHMRLIVNKVNIDLRGNNSKWQTQYDPRFGTKKKQDVSCWKACKVILSNYGVVGGDLKNNKALFQIATEKDNKLVVNPNIAQNAIKYINEQLELNKPILVGVDHTYKYKGGFNNDFTTDHFIVIVGRGYDKDKGDYYLFYEVGTKHKTNGTSDNNKLFVQEDFSLKGATVYKKSHIYTVTQIRENF
ncbi:hypothetical protein [Xanthovirga aplysinae]|uniref:hypothetical protein n=1 Tax=Xanthovirga aplysinae TaxID=2529853 RepID=UPI0012BD437A|nr:hypothetical protein [Xanthovirga aplysinae]MTI31745.1 hypothetical protein [Xanthovirga aplysinae]